MTKITLYRTTDRRIYLDPPSEPHTSFEAWHYDGPGHNTICDESGGLDVSDDFFREFRRRIWEKAYDESEEKAEGLTLLDFVEKTTAAETEERLEQQWGEDGRLID